MNEPEHKTESALPAVSAASPVARAGRHLVHGSLHVLAVNVAAVAVGFAVHVYLARLLGVAEYGRYVVSIAAIGWLAVFCVGGLDTVCTRFAALYAATREQQRIAALLQFSILAGCGLAVVAGALTAWALQTDMGARFPAGASLRIGVLALPVVVISRLRQGLLRGLQHPTLAIVPESLVVPIALMAVVGIGTACRVLPRSSTAFVSAWVLASLAAMLIGWLPTAARTCLVRRPDFRQCEFAAWRSLSLASLVVSAAIMIMGQSDLLLLGLLGRESDAGVYAPAARVAAFVAFGMNAVNTSLAPLVVQWRGEPAGLRRIAATAARLSAAFGAPVAVLMMVAPAAVLKLFGQEFTAGAGPLRILVLGQLGNVLLGSVGMLLTMSGHHRTHTCILVVGAGVNLLLNCLLIPRYGPWGAAAGTAIVMLGWNVAGFLAVRYHLRIRSTAF